MCVIAFVLHKTVIYSVVYRGQFSTNSNSKLFIYKRNNISKEMRKIDEIKNFAQFLNETQNKNF